MNNTETAFYNTLDNNYHIILKKTHKKLFSQENNFKFLCEYQINSSIDIHILNIQCTEVDIIRLLDSFYYALENNLMNMIYTFTSINPNSTLKGFKLETIIEDFDITGIYNSDKAMFRIIIFEYTNTEQIIIRAKINFKDLSEIYNFLDLSYIFFLKDYYEYDSDILSQIDVDIDTLSSYFEVY